MPKPIRSMKTVRKTMKTDGLFIRFGGSSGQPLTGHQGMPGQKLLCAHASAAFALERENPERLLAAGDDDAVPARFYDLAWRTGTPIGHFCLPDLQQERLWFGGQKRVCAGPRVQGANAVPQAAR